MATKIRNKPKLFTVPAFPRPPAEYSSSYMFNKDLVLRLYLQGVDEALKQALQYDSDDIIDGSIPNSKLENSTVSFGGVTLSLGGVDATPAFDLSDATGYPTSSLVGTITNAQLAGSIENAKLSNSTVSYGGVQLSLGGTDATPAFDLSDATNYPTSSLSGTIATAQIADDAVTDAKLANSINAAIAANTAKVTNATHTGEVTGATALTIADGAVVTDRIADDAVTDAKLANSINAAITANTAKVTNATHTGEVTGATALTIADGAVVTARIADDAVTSAKITGPFSSKHAFSNNFSQTISTTAAVTVFTFSIPAPAGGVEATQSLSASIQVRFYNSSSSAVKENHQWKVLTQMKSKTVGGTSLGTATFVASPSSYDAWYTVSGDKTSIICSNRGNFATSITGASAGSMVAVYYDAASDKTFFRVSKFPDATTVYNGVEVFYSPTAFVSPGTYVSNQGFNTQYLTIGSTTAYQTVELPLMATFGRSTTATDLRIQFDHVSSTTNLSTVITGLYGHVENTV